MSLASYLIGSLRDQMSVHVLYLCAIWVDTKLNLGPYYNDIEFFNALPSHIRDVLNIPTFRRTLKAYLINRVFYTLEEYFNNKQSNCDMTLF
nr:unnamed protein product [Callosobruchus analis]